MSVDQCPGVRIGEYRKFQLIVIRKIDDRARVQVCSTRSTILRNWERGDFRRKKKENQVIVLGRQPVRNCLWANRLVQIIIFRGEYGCPLLGDCK